MKEEYFDETSHFVIGVSGIAFCSIFIFLQSCSCFLFLKYDEFWSIPTFKIMFSMGLMEVLQLSMHFYASLISMKVDLPDWMDNFFGATGNAAFNALMPQVFALALNRFIAMRSLKQKTMLQQRSFKLIILGCWLYFGLFFAILYLPYTGVTFDHKILFWGYESGIWTPYISNFDLFSTVLALTLSLITCVSTIYILRSLRKVIQWPSTTIKRRELKLLVQSVVIFLYTTAFNVTWHIYSRLTPQTPWVAVLINFIWIFLGGLNPIMYLTMNRPFRHRFLQLLGMRFLLETSFSKSSVFRVVVPSRVGVQ